jgi:hypothetical protein
MLTLHKTKIMRSLNLPAAMQCGVEPLKEDPFRVLPSASNDIHSTSNGEAFNMLLNQLSREKMEFTPARRTMACCGWENKNAT